MPSSVKLYNALPHVTFQEGRGIRWRFLENVRYFSQTFVRLSVFNLSKQTSLIPLVFHADNSTLAENTMQRIFRKSDRSSPALKNMAGYFSRGRVTRLSSSNAAAMQYFTSTGRLNNYLDRYLTRLHDFYLDEGCETEATALSKDAIHELARQLGLESGLEETESLRKAKVMMLRRSYSQCEQPLSIAASDKLQIWAEYVDEHLQATVIPTQGQQRHQQKLAGQAESAAEDSWPAYRASRRDQLQARKVGNLPRTSQSQPDCLPLGRATMGCRADVRGVSPSVPLLHYPTQGSSAIEERIKLARDFTSGTGCVGSDPFASSQNTEFQVQNTSSKSASPSTCKRKSITAGVRLIYR